MAQIYTDTSGLRPAPRPQWYRRPLIQDARTGRGRSRNVERRVEPPSIPAHRVPFPGKGMPLRKYVRFCASSPCHCNPACTCRVPRRRVGPHKSYIISRAEDHVKQHRVTRAQMLLTSHRGRAQRAAQPRAPAPCPSPSPSRPARSRYIAMKKRKKPACRSRPRTCATAARA